MEDSKLKDLSSEDKAPSETSREKPSEKKSLKEQPPKKKKRFKRASSPSWHTFVQDASVQDIRKRFRDEFQKILSKHKGVLSNYCFLAIIDSESILGTYDLDQIFSALLKLNPERDKDVALMLLCRGGNIEPAYQISKLCKAFSKDRFVVLIPRFAKSAATLLAIGADEIHMGPLGQLGPIDPQLGGLPALGVSQALESIAKLSERFPGSSDMFARYLRMALTVEQIGYCERISESAAQYAERLLSTKPSVSKKAAAIARELVHEYKDHDFVIDLEEARQHLGADWICTDTPELVVAEELYNLFDVVNLFLGIHQSKRILVIGEIDSGILIFDKQRS